MSRCPRQPERPLQAAGAVNGHPCLVRSGEQLQLPPDPASLPPSPSVWVSGSPEGCDWRRSAIHPCLDRLLSPVPEMKGRFIKTGHKSSLPPTPRASPSFPPLFLPACPCVVYTQVGGDCTVISLPLQHQALRAFAFSITKGDFPFPQARRGDGATTLLSMHKYPISSVLGSSCYSIISVPFAIPAGPRLPPSRRIPGVVPEVCAYCAASEKGACGLSSWV